MEAKYSTKTEIGEELQRLYTLGDSLKEEDVMEQHPEFYASSVGVYGDWKTTLQKHGLRRQKIIEREKFLLYWIMKKRFEEHGDEAIRHINIQPQELKDRITAAFKTVKGLRRHFYSWNEERVLFEVRAHLLAGGSIDHLEDENTELYQAVKPFYDNLDELKEAYDDAFGMVIPHEETVSSKETPLPASGIEDILIDFLKELDYFKDMDSKADIVQHVIGARKITKSEVIDYLVEQLAVSRKKGETFKEEDIKKENPPMYYAFKQYFKTMREAFTELLSKVQ